MKIIIICITLIGFINCYSQDNDTINTTKLKEIVVKENPRSVGKYKIEIPKKILENETLDKTILRVEYITKDSYNDLYFKGKKINSIYLEDRMISIEEFYKLSLDKIKSIQIELDKYNQSSGNSETALIIKEKTSLNDNINGSIDAGYGFIQDFAHGGISLNNKIKDFYNKLDIGNIYNYTNNSVDQSFNQENERIINFRKLNQKFISLQNTYKISNSSSISIKNRLNFLNENSNSKSTRLNNIFTESDVRNYNFNLLYDLLILKKYTLKLNFDYLNNQSQNESELNLTELNSERKFEEYSISPLISKKWSKSSILYSFTFTNRNYNFVNTNETNLFKQEILNNYLKFNYKINDNNSFFIGSKYQFENNNKINKRDDYFLPFLKYYTNLDSIVEIEFAYDRGINRPSIASISNSIIYDSNGNLIVNKSYLKPEIINNFEIDLTKTYKKINFNINLGYSFSKDFIIDRFDYENDQINNTIINIEKYYQKRILTSVSFNLFKEIRFNANYGLSYIYMKNENEKFTGYINRYDFSISGPIFKKYLFTINSFFIDKFYAFNYHYNAKPDFDLMLSRNLFKEKLNLSIRYRSILNNELNRKLNFTQETNNYSLNSLNQSNMISISLSFSFGKEFKNITKNIRNINSDIKE